jgi:D-amino peptidase
MEGTSGIAHWDETDYDRGGRWYEYFRLIMSAEVAAACSGAHDGGARHIRVKDAHDSARNIIPSERPSYAELNRGWSGHPFCMVSGVEEGFGALAFTGYHSPAHSAFNPLAHTLTTDLDEITINGIRASEFLIHSYIAAMLNIPVIFLSGDMGICEEAKTLIPGIVVVPTNYCRGNGVSSNQPQASQQLIHDGMKRAVENNGVNCIPKLPSSFEVTVKYHVHHHAYKNSFYPGTTQVGEKTIAFSSDNYWDVMRFFHFTT